MHSTGGMRRCWNWALVIHNYSKTNACSAVTYWREEESSRPKPWATQETQQCIKLWFCYGVLVSLSNAVHISIDFFWFCSFAVRKKKILFMTVNRKLSDVRQRQMFQRRISTSLWSLARLSPLWKFESACENEARAKTSLHINAHVLARGKWKSPAWLQELKKRWHKCFLNMIKDNKLNLLLAGLWLTLLNFVSLACKLFCLKWTHGKRFSASTITHAFLLSCVCLQKQATFCVTLHRFKVGWTHTISQMTNTIIYYCICWNKLICFYTTPVLFPEFKTS